MKSIGIVLLLETIKVTAFPMALRCSFLGLFSFLCKVLFRFRVEGKEIVDAFAGKTTGAILVSPHYSYLDVIIMFLSVRPKGWVRLIARDSLFRAGKGFLGMVISSVGAFPSNEAVLTERL